MGSTGMTERPGSSRIPEGSPGPFTGTSCSTNTVATRKAMNPLRVVYMEAGQVLQVLHCQGWHPKRLGIPAAAHFRFETEADRYLMMATRTGGQKALTVSQDVAGVDYSTLEAWRSTRRGRTGWSANTATPHSPTSRCSTPPASTDEDELAAALDWAEPDK